MQLAARMRPAIGELQRLATSALGTGQCVVAGIAVDLQGSVKAVEDLHGMAAFTAIAIRKHDGRRILAAPTPVITGQSPKVSGFGLAGTRIKHGRPGLVHKQARRGFDMVQHTIDDEREVMRGNPAPGCQGRAIQINAAAGVDLGLPEEGQVIAKFGGRDMRHERFGG